PLSLHDALPISRYAHLPAKARRTNDIFVVARKSGPGTWIVGRRRGHPNVPAEFRELLEGPHERSGRSAAASLCHRHAQWRRGYLAEVARARFENNEHRRKTKLL